MRYPPDMKKLIALVVTSSLILVSVPTFADDTGIQAIPPGDDKIVPLKKGDPAPFDGQLFEPNTALRWGNWLLQYKQRLKSDVELERKLCDSDKKLLDRKLTLEQEKYTTVVTDLQGRLAKAEYALNNQPFYKSPWFGFTAGVLSAGAIIGLTAWALHK